MSGRKLDVGTAVRFTRAEAGARAPAYRVEELVELGDGITLYKIRSEAEPFDRVVAASDLAVLA